MKKIILAAAIASVLAPLSAVADTKIYGALRLSAVSGDNSNDGGNDSGVTDNASRIGIKGSYGTDGGLTGFVHIQEGVQTDVNGGAAFSNRFAFAGVKGGFGKVVLGRLSSPYKMAGLKVDPFYDTSAGPLNGGSNYGLSTLTNGFLNNVVGYVSPKLGGSVTLNVVAVLDKDDDAANLIPTALQPAGFNANSNKFNIGATYSASGITASLQHITEVEATRATIGYKAGPFGLGLSYEDLANGDQTYLSGTYKVAPKTTVAVGIGSVSNTGAGPNVRDDAGDGYSLGVFHKLAPKTTLTAMLSEVDYDAAASNDRDVFAIGLIQKF